MESFGAILRKAREDKNLAIEDVERETTISRQYLEGMEAEDSSVFPGEPYMVGFLRNYSEYLGLDKNEILKLYQAKKIQESPVPVELLAKTTPKFILPLVISVVLVVLAGTGIYLYFGVFKVPQHRDEKARTIAENTKIHQYEFDGNTQTKRLYKGDQILVPDSNNQDEKIILTVDDTLGYLLLETPVGKQIVELSEERDLDIDGDNKADIILYLSDVSNTDASRGAEVRMLLKSNEGYSTSKTATDLNAIPAASSTATVASRQVVLLEDTRAYPFTVQVSFRGTCLYRYRINREEYVEDYYKSGDTITVTATNSIRLWMSNVNALKISVIANSVTYDLEVGKAGQVQAEDIKWVRDSDGKYRLVVIELD